jgi:ribonuclease Z
MKFYYQFITTPTADTPGTSVWLNFPEKRYLFGHASEGTQRALTEIGQSQTSLSDLFLTGTTGWDNAGGLFGLILTLADSQTSSAKALASLEEEKKSRRQNSNSQKRSRKDDDEPKKLTVHGGKNLAHTVATGRRFIFRRGMPLQTKEYDSVTPHSEPNGDGDPFEKPTWEDNNIKVWAMSLKPSVAKAGEDADGDLKRPRKRSLDEFQERADGIETLDQAVKDQVVREGVVNDMFDSDWSLDSLVEMSLANVQMPATIFVRNPETKDLDRYRGPLPGGDEPIPDIRVLVRLPWPGARIDKLPPTSPMKESMSYIVRNHDLRGKFDINKARELKVPKGPDYSLLTRGLSVQSEDGKTITHDMVLGPPRPGKGTAFIDLPSTDYVEDLVSRPEWQSPAVTTDLKVFIWILGPGVGDDPRLREFIARKSDCKHIVSSTDYCPNHLSMHSAAASSVRLARLHGDNFPIPIHDNVLLPQAGTPTANSHRVPEPLKDSLFEAAKRGLIINMEPTFAVNTSEVIRLFDPSLALRKIPRAVEQRMATIHHRLKKPSFQRQLEELRSDLPGAEAEIFTLGTGSSSPSRYRNVSATLLHVPGQGYYLFDCGENTLGQLKRTFNPEQLRTVFQNLRMIWISHLHADHHLGTASVIKAWYKENYPNHSSNSGVVEEDMAKILKEKRLFVVSEQMMIGWLEEYASVENYGFEKLVPLAAYCSVDEAGNFTTKFGYRHCAADGSYLNSNLSSTSPKVTTLRFDDSSPFGDLLRSATGLSNVLTTLVIHCRGAMAVSLAWHDGFKVSYSGDCRPSAKFAKMGHGSTVLIHEATFDNDMAGSAIAKKHSTAGEALEVGRQMGARMVVLTHFSQRYQKIAQLTNRRQDPRRIGETDGLDDELSNEPEDSPRLRDSKLSRGDDLTLSRKSSSETPAYEAPYTVAFDYMRVKVKDIPIAQQFSPAFEKLISRLERAQEEESEMARVHREAEAAVNPKLAQRNAKKKQGKPAAIPTQSIASAPVQQAEPKKSAWSASESESGWTLGESEGEAEKWPPAL